MLSKAQLSDSTKVQPCLLFCRGINWRWVQTLTVSHFHQYLQQALTFLCPYSTQSVCLKVLNVQHKCDWNHSKLWECNEITFIQLPVGCWARMKIKVTNSSMWCHLGWSPAFPSPHCLFLLLHVLCRLRPPPWACSSALQKTNGGKKVVLFFSAGLVSSTGSWWCRLGVRARVQLESYG